jgi:hypothetical protein
LEPTLSANDDEISALQHAMNLKLQDEASFQSEYQNDPFPDDMENDSLLSIDEIAAKINGLPEQIVPLYCDHVTAFIDIQKTLLFYTVVAWGEDFVTKILYWWPPVAASIEPAGTAGCDRADFVGWYQRWIGNCFRLTAVRQFF